MELLYFWKNQFIAGFVPLTRFKIYKENAQYPFLIL